MRTFVMGDIHGSYKALVQCLEKVRFDFKGDQLIQLGDVTDGYSEVYECVELLMKIDNLVAIRGNHDEWFNEYIQTGVHPDNWEQGGAGTAKSYLKKVSQEYIIPPHIPESHQRFFKYQRMFYIDDDNNCFVHAGFDRHLPFIGQLPETYYWDRELWRSALSFEAFRRGKWVSGKFKMVTKFNEIFIGHTPTTNWQTDKPMKAANINNLDTGAGHGSRLTIMDVKTKEYWQSDLTGELYGEIVR